MKKILVALLVMALVAPAFAVSISGTDLGSGKMRLSYNVPAGEVLRGIALSLNTTVGTATITTGAVTAIEPKFNTFIDYAFSTPVGYTIGAGNPLANPAAAGVLDLASPKSAFSLSMGALDQTGAQGGVTGSGTLCEIQYAITGASATIHVAADTLRGGAVVGDAVTQPAAIDVVLNGAPPVCTITGLVITKAVNPGFVNTDVTSVAASGAVSSLGHTPLNYGFNWGAGVGAYGLATQTNTYAFAAAGTQTVTVTAHCTVCGATAVSTPMTLTREAVKSTATFYNDWKASTPLRAGRMSCWAFKKQCKGDANGVSTGTGKKGYVAVQTLDLGILTGAWNILEPATGTVPSGPGLNNAQMCADFNHIATGTGKKGYVRVQTLDLGILTANWNILEPATGTVPSGPGIGDCPAGDVNFYTN
jgi:hypothetical protein